VFFVLKLKIGLPILIEILLEVLGCFTHGSVECRY